MTYLSDYRIGSLTNIHTGTGTMDVSGTGVTGYGSAFLTELNIGDVLLDTYTGEAHAIATITADDAATVNTPFLTPDTGLDVKYVPLVNIESLTGGSQLAPKGSFQPYAEALNLGNSLVRGGGLPTDSWLFAYMPKDLRDVLRAYCAGASNEVYMRTRVIDGVASDGEDKFQTFDAVMIWPLDESRERPKGTRVPFTIAWRALVEL